MVGTIIAAAVAIGTAIYSGIKTAKANKQAKEETNAMYSKQQGDLMRKIHANPFENADTQAVLGRFQRDMQTSVNQARARQVMTGGQDTSVMAKQKNAEALQGIYQRILSNNEAKKETAENNLSNSQLSQRQYNINAELARKQNIAQSVANVGKGLSSLAGAFGSGAGAGITSMAKANIAKQGQAQAMAGMQAVDNQLDAYSKQVRDSLNAEWRKGLGLY